MFSAYKRMPVARQIILVAAALLVVVFTVMTLVATAMTAKSALALAEQDLGQQVKLMAGMLDTQFDGVLARGQRQMDYFRRHLPGEITPGQGLVPTGNVDLPVIRSGGETLNGNHRILQAFKDLTGDEAAILAIHEGRVFRIATLLKKDGAYMDGTEIKAGDPVADALLAGKDYGGLAIRNGGYFFSTVQLLKTADGKAFGAVSVRIDLAEELKQIRELFAKVVVAKTGYVYILRPTHDDKTLAEFVAHPKLQGKTLEGENGPLRDSIARILATPDGLLKYSFADADGKQREKLGEIVTSQRWGWRLGAASWKDEFLEESLKLRDFLMLASAVAALLACGLIFVLVRQRLKPLMTVVMELEQVGTGDLTVRVADADPLSASEVDHLGVALNKTVANVRSLVAEIADASRRVGSAASQVENSSHEAMLAAEQQSQSAAGMAAAVEEVSVSITHVAENAAEAASVSEQAKVSSRHGREVVGTTAAEMDRIAGEITRSADIIQSLGDRSQQIFGIVGVIKEIADQTNLLALNAAIEAARAGEQGRGFAVVADEVRKLAERTSHSTQEIADTITAITSETSHAVSGMQEVSRQVAAGVQLAREAGGVLETIDGQTERAVMTVHGIADSTREQSVASQEIAKLVEQIAQMAEEGNATAAQNTEYARHLQKLAQELQFGLDRFKV